MRAVAGPRRLAGSGRAPGSRVIAFATWLLALLGAGLMYVSFEAQYRFILAQKGDQAASLIGAAMLDAGMVILSALGIGLARAGQPSRSAPGPGMARCSFVRRRSLTAPLLCS